MYPPEVHNEITKLLLLKQKNSVKCFDYVMKCTKHVMNCKNDVTKYKTAYEKYAGFVFTSTNKKITLNE